MRRWLIAQGIVVVAIVEGLTIVTRDDLVTAYAVPSVWE
jgi:hypothetical protein